MGQCDTPKERIECLLCAKQMHFPEQPIDWEYLLNKFASSSSRFHNEVLFQEQMPLLFCLWVACQSVLKLLHSNCGVTTSRT
jgi:hypothetical protein